jgi:hypothetical protein
MMVQGKHAMPLQRTIALCGLVLTVACGCLRPTAQGESIDVVSNTELVKYCTPKGEGKYTAVGEKNALTLAKNAAAERGGNVLLTVAISKGDSFTTEVYGKIYACTQKP